MTAAPDSLAGLLERVAGRLGEDPGPQVRLHYVAGSEDDPAQAVVDTAAALSADGWSWSVITGGSWPGGRFEMRATIAGATVAISAPASAVCTREEGGEWKPLPAITAALEPSAAPDAAGEDGGEAQ